MLWKLNFITIWVFKFNYRVWAEEKIKYILWKWTLHGLERYLVLEMLTLRTAHAERDKERAHLQNNVKATPEQLKLSKTSPSMWLQIDDS
jgi:hypothetical protein